MKRTVVVLVCFVLVICFAGCEQLKNFYATKVKPVLEPAKTSPAVTQEQSKGTMLAKVNGKVITYEEFEQNIKNLQALAEDIKIDTFETRKDLLDEMVNQELMYQEAKSRGIPNRKEVKELADGYFRGLVVRQLILDTTENATVDAQEIETFYNTYKDQLTEPEERRVREIVVGEESLARQVLIELLQGQDFATTARQRSLADSSANGGDVGLISKGQRGPEYQKYDEIAFALGAGEVSSVFKGPKGYYVIKVEEVKATAAKSLTDVWDDVKDTLLKLKQQQRVQDLTDKLRRDATIELNEALLK